MSLAGTFAGRVLLVAFAVVAAGCERSSEIENSTFYERKIEPAIQTAACSPSGAGSSCHVADDRGDAVGNLSFQSFETLNRRRDLLTDYGPYGVPGLLLKVVPPYKVNLTSWDDTPAQNITIDMAHGGGRQIDFTSAQFTTLDTWIRNGAAENNAPPGEPDRTLAPCSDAIGQHPDFDPSVEPSTPDYPQFADTVSPVLGEKCANGNCHGSPSNNLHLTCGTTLEQKRWNYFAAADYVSANATASEILRRALAPDAGGTFHEGGTVFKSRDDLGYVTLENWAIAKGGPSNPPTDPEFLFFAQRVQPMLVKRGCMMLGCHSSSMFHDYRLRGGSGGQFSLPATRRNYELSLEQLALESPEPGASRLIRKNLSPSVGGITHRGGSLFGDGSIGVDGIACDPDAAQNGPIDEQRPYCVIVEWFKRERAAKMATSTPLSAVVFVRRAPSAGADTPQDFATYQPGAEVIQTAVTRADDGTITSGAETNLTTLCGLDAGATDARRPAVSWDGRRIAFAARTSASDPFHVYVVDGGACAIDAAIDANPEDDAGNAVPSNGELVHNFDPAFAPDGRVVFASTRGNITNLEAIGYSGPQRTPADPSKLNANLYVRESNGSIRQLTFLTNQEILPSFMRDGRLIFTTEKRAPDFYQLAGRRINLDGGDYHPLFGQRSTIDFTQVTDIVELADKNLAFILSEKGAQKGAGTLGVLNRSVGVDQLSRTPEDYLVDPTAIDVTTKRFLQRSLRIVNTDATGKLSGTAGAYKNPSPLPDGRLLVSYAPNVVALDAVSGGFRIDVMNPETGEHSQLIADAARDCIWPAAVYAKQNIGVFRSRLDEANGATKVTSGNANAEVTFLDTGIISSFLFQNTRSGRVLPSPGGTLGVWESLPPEASVTDYASGGSFVTTDRYGQLYARRQLLGNVAVKGDGSAAMRVPGGVPIVLETNAKLSGAAIAAHAQREEVQYYPGEELRQGFPRRLFNGLCGGCHGSVSGAELDLAVKPDILTTASQVEAKGSPTNLTGPPRGAPQAPPYR